MWLRLGGCSGVEAPARAARGPCCYTCAVRPRSLFVLAVLGVCAWLVWTQRARLIPESSSRRGAASLPDEPRAIIGSHPEIARANIIL